MSIKKFATSAAVVASMLAANLSPLAATAASARDWRNQGDYSYSRGYDGPRYDGRGRGHRYEHGHRYGHYQHYKRDRHGRDVAKGVAIGLGILAVGSILASGAHR
jgi:hypothetical protein